KLADAPKSLINNNGVPLRRRQTSGDGTRAGPFFQPAGFAGLRAQDFVTCTCLTAAPFAGFVCKDFVTLTIGRQNTIFLDNIVKYDPMNASYAFSIIGYSGLAGGVCATEDARLDDSLKYVWKYDAFHIGAMYQFENNDTSPGESWQL